MSSKHSNVKVKSNKNYGGYSKHSKDQKLLDINNDKNKKYHSSTSRNTQEFQVIDVHPQLPDFPQNQGELFFECTLFLYSVLALFLMYLTLYKTLWWLPNSYWPTSLKYYLINPYLLSCIGLMLGIRVTKCFWNNLTEMFVIITQGKESTLWTIVEYGFLKAPICTMIFSSFLFSFTKVYIEYGIKAFIYFIIPLIVYLLLLLSSFNGIKECDRMNLKMDQKYIKILNVFIKIIEYIRSVIRTNKLLNIETTEHTCSTIPLNIRKEVDVLCHDFYNRLKYSAFAGFSTAYLSIYLPLAFIPQKTVYGIPQYMLMNSVWITKIFILVLFTSFSVYFTYLLPLNYLNLLQKCAFHLGGWVETVNTLVNKQDSVEYSDEFLYPANDKVIVKYKDRYYKSKNGRYSVSIAAIPGDTTQALFFNIACNPVKFVTCLCIFEFCLILFEFIILLTTNDWQQIVTLVLLMFANYLLLGKLFKDRVVIGRIYNPSGEDIKLFNQVRNSGRSTT